MAFPIGAAVTGVLGIAGALGSGRRRNPYEGQINQLMGQMRGMSSQYGQQAGMARQDASYYRPQARRASGEYANYLRGQMGGASSVERAAVVARETGAVDAAYRTGASQLSADLARRGVTDSSALSGGLASLAGQRAASYGQAASGANRYFDERQTNAGQQLVQLLGGLESEAYGRQQAALGSQSNTLNGLMSLLGNRQAQWQQQEDSRYSGQMGLLGSLGETAGYLWGNKKG